MSSPAGPFAPMIDRIRQLYHKGEQFLNHPIDSTVGMVPDQHQQSHQQAIDEMNRQTNSHNNDPANATFQHNQPSLSTMKKPLGK